MKHRTRWSHRTRTANYRIDRKPSLLRGCWRPQVVAYRKGRTLIVQWGRFEFARWR
jgi:hypothetical protein